MQADKRKIARREKRKMLNYEKAKVPEFDGDEENYN